MSETVREKSQAALAEVEELSQAILPEPEEATAIVPLSDADAGAGAEIR